MITLQKALDIDIRFPVIQAPMADVQDSELAITVANAGGLGCLPCAMLSLEKMRKKFFNRMSLRAASPLPDGIERICFSISFWPVFPARSKLGTA